MEFSKEDNEAVEWCEKNYQDITTEYKKIMMEQYILFCKKHRNYGTGNINVGTNLDTDADVKLALTGIWFRLNDKITDSIGIYNIMAPTMCHTSSLPNLPHSTASALVNCLTPPLVAAYPGLLAKPCSAPMLVKFMMLP